jgi:hypothetical protein
MRIGYMEWHDGIPYDLDALDALTPTERRSIERRLIARRYKDWRDSEALGRLGTTAALDALRSSLTGRNREVRLRAGEILREKGLPVDLDGLVVEGLRNADIGDGFVQATNLAARFPSPAIEKTLLHGARCSPDRSIFFPAVLLYLHGQATTPNIDFENQQFCQRFRVPPGAARDPVFQELCQRIGADPSSVSCSEPFPSAKPASGSWGIRLLAALRILVPLGILAVVLWRCVGPLVEGSSSARCLVSC